MSNDEKETPDWLFKTLDKVFHFDWDAACTTKNCKIPRYNDVVPCRGFTIDTGFDALVTGWGNWTNGPVFLNPPYSNLYKFMEKAYTSDLEVVCIVPSDTSTRWWHEFVMHAAYIYWPNKRIDFGVGNGAKFATSVVHFLPEYRKLVHYNDEVPRVCSWDAKYFEREI